MYMKKITNLLIGTNNKGKLKEIRSLLPNNIITLSTSRFRLKSPKENGKTFEQNSLIKSKYFSKKTNLVCLADDSGLEIDLLNKKPGIYSARWGGKNLDFKKAIKKVYRELNKKNKNWKKKKTKFKTGSRKIFFSSDQKSGGFSTVADSAVILVLAKTLIFGSKQLPEIRQKFAKIFPLQNRHGHIKSIGFGMVLFLNLNRFLELEGPGPQNLAEKTPLRA